MSSGPDGQESEIGVRGAILMLVNHISGCRRCIIALQYASGAVSVLQNCESVRSTILLLLDCIIPINKIFDRIALFWFMRYMCNEISRKAI